jgi:1,4-dihydroxy-2-naphthoate octaprenyltransferase
MTSANAWFLAARPKTLGAAVAPVLLAGTLASKHGVFDLWPWTAALVCAILIQVGTNFANDYFDHQKGADTPERIGFKRATSSGWIAPGSMWRATVATMAAAFVLGLSLVWHAGWPILLIGVLSILFGFLYTGGPYPLGYNGLGDLFVFLFFGLAAVMGTYYAMANRWSAESFWVALAVGALAVNLLVVNNLRDVETDRKAGKRTLGVIFGERALKMEYTLMLLLAYSIPPHLFVQEGYRWTVFLPVLALPLLAKPLRLVWTHTEKSVLNGVLIRTGAFQSLFSLLLALGIWLDMP